VTLREAETRLRRALVDPEVDRLERLTAAALLGSPAGEWWDPSWFAGIAEVGPDRPILGDSFRLSPSQATAYEACPRRYALERRLRLGDADSPWAQFGSLIHKALELAEAEILGTGKPHADPDRALEALDEVWAEASFGTPELDQAWLGKAREVLSKLYENWPTPDGIPEALETHVEAEIDGVRWLGKVDRIERTAAGLRVVDYKTSTTPATKKEAAESVQLGFYASAIDGEEVVGAEFWYPRTSAKSITTPRFDMGRIEEVRERMVELTRAIRSENWEPKVGRHCNRCAFKLSCPAWPEGRGAFLP
jgi:RecB family exonuclease